MSDHYDWRGRLLDEPDDWDEPQLTEPQLWRRYGRIWVQLADAHWLYFAPCEAARALLVYENALENYQAECAE